MSDADGKRAWVATVLGVDLPRRSSSAFDMKRLRAAVAEYHDTLAEVGSGVGALQDKMRASDNPLMQQIAKVELKELTGGMRVTMSAALLDIIQAPDNRRARNAKVFYKLCGKMTQFVEGNELFTYLDTNPLGVKVNSRDGLLSALRTLEQEVAASLG